VAPLLTQNEQVMGWRITAIETRLTAMDQRLDVYSTRQAANTEQLVAMKNGLERQEARLIAIEKRVGEVEWRGLSERLVRLETSADQAKLILNAIGLAVIAQLIGTIWRVVIDRKNGNGKKA